MAYEYINKKGQKYYLHSNGRLTFFSKKSEKAIELPPNMRIVENPKTGLPFIKKKYKTLVG